MSSCRSYVGRWARTAGMLNERVSVRGVPAPVHARRLSGSPERALGTLRGLLFPVDGVLIADHMAHGPDDDEGQDYDDVEHDH
jgi:hypothetical protein